MPIYPSLERFHYEPVAGCVCMTEREKEVEFDFSLAFFIYLGYNKLIY